MNTDRTTTNPSARETGNSGSSGGLSPQAVSLVAGVIGVAFLSAGLATYETPPSNLVLIFVWTLAALVGELMVFPTLTNRGHISLSTTMHLAMVLCLDPGQLVATVILSRGIAMFIAQRQVWYRALFNVASVLGGVLAAAYTFRLLLGGEPAAFTAERVLQVAPAFLAAAAVYYALCAAAASGILALLTRDTLWRVWRENFGYAAEVVGTVGLVLLAPVMALCFQSVGWVGLAVFLLPMVLVRMTSTRYIALRQTQGTLIAAERLAAKGEIAAEVGHDIKNFLHGISAQLHFLEMKGTGMEAEEYERRIRTALEQLEKANHLSEGLMAFSCRESQPRATYLGELVERTVRFLKPQKRFEGVGLELDLDPRIGEISVDPNQVQQMLMNLMLNAANAMYESSCSKKVIWVTLRLHESSEEVELLVADSGPGISAEVRERIFEPGFTTRSEGHGFGLSTVHRVVSNHEGRIRVEENPGGGALFRIFLPARRSSGERTVLAA